MVRVRFFETTSSGQQEVASLTLMGLERHVTGDRELIDEFLASRELSEITNAELLELMKDAPRRFDGAYLRASLEPQEEAAD
jgi:hypothetical protein